MGTALAKVEASNYLALQEGGEIAEAMAANLGDQAFEESDLTHAKAATAGGKTFIIPSIAGDEMEDTVEGILVHTCRRGLLWPDYDPVPGTRPVLITDDLTWARKEGDIPEWMQAELARCYDADRNAYDWEKLEYNQWDSGKDGVGKRCTEQRIFFILRKDDPLPIVITAGPGSLKAAKKFIIQLSIAGIAYWRAVVKFTLEPDKNEKGIKFSKVVPELVATLSKVDGEVSKAYGLALSGQTPKKPSMKLVYDDAEKAFDEANEDDVGDV